MRLKLRDERRLQRELKKERNRSREELEKSCGSKRLFTKILSKVNFEAQKWRKFERHKFSKKASHLKTIKENEEIRELEKCPQEISEFQELSIFERKRIEKMKKEKVVVSSIGGVELDEDEKQF